MAPGARMLIAASLGLAAAALAGRARAADPDAERPPIPEPIIVETTTDIDADTGEYEIEANAQSLRARAGGGYHLATEVEAEWLITRRFGLRLEPELDRDLDGAGAGAQTSVAGSLAVSYKLLHDFRHDFHLQIEAAARLPFTHALQTEPGQSGLPLVVDLPVAWRPGPVTLRGFVGAGLGGIGEHLPARGGLALLSAFGRNDRFGFWGVELEADGARRAPFVAALDVMPSLLALGIPLRLGVAIPWVIGARADEPSLGLLFRVLLESPREVKYGEGR